MALTQRIGDFYFLSLAGEVVPPSTRVEVVARPGINGAGYWFLGALGEPFILRSRVDAVNLAYAQAAFDQYLLLKDALPVILVKDGLDFTAADNPWKVKVIDVRLAVCKKIIGGIGGLNPPGLGWLEADWQLQAVEI